MQGRNPQGAPRILSSSAHQLTFYHFYPVAEKGGKPPSKSRWTGLGSEQPEIVARNMATLESVQCKDRINIQLG